MHTLCMSLISSLLGDNSSKPTLWVITWILPFLKTFSWMETFDVQKAWINLLLCTFLHLGGPILESKRMHTIFQKKDTKGKKGKNIWKFGQKSTKFENILKKGRWFCANIACNKLLEKALLGPYLFVIYTQAIININWSINSQRS